MWWESDAQNWDEKEPKVEGHQKDKYSTLFYVFKLKKKYLTHEVSKVPTTQDLVAQSGYHDRQSQQQIREGQRGYEHVTGSLESWVQRDATYDGQVAKNRQNGD